MTLDILVSVHEKDPRRVSRMDCFFLPLFPFASFGFVVLYSKSQPKQNHPCFLFPVVYSLVACIGNLFWCLLVVLGVVEWDIPPWVPVCMMLAPSTGTHHGGYCRAPKIWVVLWLAPMKDAIVDAYASLCVVCYGGCHTTDDVCIVQSWQCDDNEIWDLSPDWPSIGGHVGHTAAWCLDSYLLLIFSFFIIFLKIFFKSNLTRLLPGPQ